jgi:NAD(P)H-flavin reductase/nitrate reductase NapE component
MPTYGQMLAVAMVWIINIILSSVGYRSYQPNAWFASTRLEILTYITNRTGALSFVNIVLLIIYAGRNNPLLFATNWSRSTYILLHKNVAIIATIQACLHSAIYLQIKIADGTLSTEQVSPYWIMGIVATLSMTVLLPLSIKPIRNAMYEIFLIVHIVFAILALVGGWYHIIWRFQHQWGYETWLYISFAVWGAERAIRIVRLLMYSGLEKAIILPLDQDYLKIIVPTAQQSPLEGGVIYAYFPTLSWRPWESHPFSVAGPALEWKKTSNTKSVANSPDLSEKGIIRLDKTEDTHVPESPALKNDDNNALANIQTQEYKQDWHISNAVSINGGITFFVRVRNGTTKRLAEKANHDTKICTLPVLLEGAYDCGEVGSYSTNIHSSKNQFSKIICIAGGVGITALMPILHKASKAQNIESNTAVSLHWSSRSSALVNSISSMLNITTTGINEQRGKVGMLSTHCVIGQRLEGSEVLEEEIRESEAKGKSILILVCAPTDMAQAYQNHAIAYKNLGYAVIYHVEQFSW